MANADSSASAAFAEAHSALATRGLTVRGIMNFGQDESAPSGLSGSPAKSVLLVGNVGGAFWPHFERWRRKQPRDIANPLDCWSAAIIRDVAATLRGRAVLPSERPYHPFQQWAMRAEGLRPSPLGILMHPQYGTWHAYRGAILLDRAVSGPGSSSEPHPCDSCVETPCLHACPVNAHTGSGFAYEDCLAHVRGQTGGDCRDHGCLDRNACPVGIDYRYPDAMQQFLIRAFANLP